MLPTASRILLAALAALLVLAPAAVAQNDFQRIFRDYRDDGQLNGCDYSDAELRRGQDGLPPDVEQYAPSLAEQIANARERECGGGGDGTGGSGGGAGGSDSGSDGGGSGGSSGGSDAGEVPTPPKPEAAPVTVASITPGNLDDAAARSEDSDEPSWPLVVLGVVAIVAIAALVARRFGFGDARGMGAATNEAGGRAADTAAEVKDWFRLGR